MKDHVVSLISEAVPEASMVELYDDLSGTLLVSVAGPVLGDNFVRLAQLLSSFYHVTFEEWRPVAPGKYLYEARVSDVCVGSY